MSAINRFIKKTILAFKSEKKIPISHQVNITQMLKGKEALTIGKSGSIGMAIIRSFLKNDAKVIIAGTTKDKLGNCEIKLGDIA